MSDKGKNSNLSLIFEFSNLSQNKSQTPQKFTQAYGINIFNFNKFKNSIFIYIFFFVLLNGSFKLFSSKKQKKNYVLIALYLGITQLTTPALGDNTR